MRWREMPAFVAGVAALLLLFLSSLGAPSVAVAAAPPAGAVAVAVLDRSGPEVPRDGADGEVVLQHRHKAGKSTVSSAGQPAVLCSSPVLPDGARHVSGLRSSRPGPHGAARVPILRC